MSLDSNLQSAFTAVGTAIKGKISSSEKGAVNGVATLDGAGKLTASQLPASAIGGMIYQGVWNASTNSPAIPASAVGNKGHYYKVSVAGSTTIDTIGEWKVGDWIVSNGSVWDKIDNTDQVSTVAGRTGAVVLGTSDITGLDTALSGKEATITTLPVSKGGTGANTLTGIIKGNGTGAMTAATAGTDYVIPSGNVATATKLATARNINGTAFDGSADITLPVATTSVAGTMSAADKTKLDGIATGANNYTLPAGTSSNLGGIKLASDTVQSTAANAVTSTASRTYGVQVNASGQAVVNVPWVDTDTTYAVATTSVNGLMSSTDKTKLDGVATNANNYAHPTGDGNLHVPATSTTNNGKVLMAGATAGSLSWTSLAISDTSGLQAALDAKATASSVTTLSNNVGATDTNYVTVFNAALV